MFNGHKSTRYYVDIHHITLFETLMKEQNIKFVNEIEHLTDTKSEVFYVREIDIDKVDKICLQNGIPLYDDFSPNSQHLFWIHKLPRNLKVFVLFIIFIFVLYTIFGNII